MKIRLWRIGSAEEKIIPTTEAIKKLENLLSNKEGKDVIDVVWGPHISCEIIDTDPKFIEPRAVSGNLMRVGLPDATGFPLNLPLEYHIQGT